MEFQYLIRILADLAVEGFGNGLEFKQTDGTGTSTYRVFQDDYDLFVIQRTGDTTGDGAVWSLVDLRSPTMATTDDSEATLSLTTRSGAPGGVARTLDIYNDEYSRDNGMGFRQLIKNTALNPMRWEAHDKTTNNGAWTMSGVSLTSGSANGTYTSVSGLTPSVEDWIWDNAGTYISDDTKIIAINTTAKTFTMNRVATSTGSGLSVRGKNIREYMRLTPLRQLLVRKFIATDSDTVAEFGGKVRVDGNIIGLTDPTSAQDAATKAYVDAADATKVTGTTKITVSTTAPSSPSVGDLWVDTN